MITLKGIKKNFGLFDAIKGIDLRINKGDFTVIVGQNGAGKSTLLKIMAGLMRPTSGKIVIDGKPLDAFSGMHRKGMGVVVHQTCIYPSLSAYSNLHFFGRLFSIEELPKRIEEVLRRVGLWDRRDDPVNTYSCGMKQRLAIARAVLHRPDLLLLDEPFTGLDAGAVKDLKGLLSGFKQEGKTIVMVTHQLQEGYDLAQRLIVMRDGRIALSKYKFELSWKEFEEIYHSTGGFCGLLS